MTAAGETMAPAPAGLARWLPPQRLVMGMFFLQAAALNNWFPRIPDIQAKLDLSPGALAIALIAMPIGGAIGTSIAPRVIERFSARRALAYAYIVFTVLLILPGWAWDLPSLFGALLLMGVAYTVNDVSANVEASRIQASLGRRILSTCHGFWSLGSVVGLVAGSAFSEWQIAPRWHLMLMLVFLAPIAVSVARSLPRLPPTAEERARVPFLTLPLAAMLGLCVFAFGSIVGELTTRNWGAVYARDILAASAAGAGAGYAAFSITMTAGRFIGDRLADRFGAAAVGRICALLTTAGFALLVVTDNLTVGIAAFALVGAGLSVVMPLSVSTAANFGGGRSAAVNVAALSLVAYSGSLVGPPLVGFVADAWGLRVGLAAIIPLVLLSAVFAGHLGRRAS